MLAMSNTVFTVIDDGSDKDAELKLVGKLNDSHTPEDIGPYTLIWRAFVTGVQTWQHDLIRYVLAYDKDAHEFSLITNNLVA